MSAFPLLLGLALLGGTARAKAKDEEPSPELLQNLDFFMKYELIKNLDLLGAARADAKDAEPWAGIRISTSATASAPAVPAGKKKPAPDGAAQASAGPGGKP